MGIGGNFWGLLKPYARNEDFDFLRNKRVAIDLSCWIVQHETALKKRARNPHLRITFFRTINLFSKFGAFPVFVVDGLPSPLKAQARIDRFFRSSGIDLSGLPNAEDGANVERNGFFQNCVRECLELLELLGLPVLKATSEAEALCAQLNSEGLADALITPDSDAFLYGAKCVIKCLRPNSKEPFECYYMSDIEAGLGLRRTHLVAISLLVGNDHDMNGVSGVGIETALSFVQKFSEEEILNRLHEIGNGEFPLSQIDSKSQGGCEMLSLDDNSPKTKSPHCSYCGHPGSKRVHLTLACKYCSVSGSENCVQKPVGFRCECLTCSKDRSNKEQKKQESWMISICSKIAMRKNFPNDEIIEMYLGRNHKHFSGNESPCLSWGSPDVETLIEFLGYHQHWDPSYIRQRILPMLSTIFLREMASNPTEGLLLHGQYEFHCIERVKIRYGHPFYLVNWRRVGPTVGSVKYIVQKEQFVSQQEESTEVHENIDLLDEPDVPEILVDDGRWFLLTDENIELVQAAFPEKVHRFLQDKEMKESKQRKRKSISKSVHRKKSESPKSSGVQLSITEFYRSSKVFVQEKHEESPETNHPHQDQDQVQEKELSKGREVMQTTNLSKSVRRRLLFD